MSRSILAVALLLSFTVLVLAAPVHAQIQPPIVYEMTGVATYKVKANGDIEVTEVIKFSTSAFMAFKSRFNPLSTFARELSPHNIPVEIKNLQIDVDDANNKVTIRYLLRGAAVYKGNKIWEIQAAAPGEKLTLTTSEHNRLVLVRTYGVGPDFRIMETLTYMLPDGAGDVHYDEASGKITYVLEPSVSAKTTVTTSYKTVTITEKKTVTSVERSQPPAAMRYAGIGLALTGAILAAVGAMKREA